MSSSNKRRHEDMRAFLSVHEDDGAEGAVLQAVGATLAAVLDSDEEEEKKWGGSRPGKAPNKKRDFDRAYDRLVQQYFSGEDSIYNETDFERRFRMPRVVFNKVRDKIMDNGSFILRHDAVGKKGIHPLCRLVTCLRLLAYGTAADSMDENLELSETVACDSLKEFAALMVAKFGPQYLNRCPTPAEKRRMLLIMKNRGWPGTFSSWDCKHFEWGNCPVRLAGQTKGHADGGKKTLILEAIADADLYIWYTFFGKCGSLNDLNILDKSSIVGAILSGTFDVSVDPYTINGTSRDWLYFLADGIYPDWSIFVKTISSPITQKEETYATSQESVRKDVERAFGALVQQFHYLKRPLRNWYLADIKNLLHCCIILHNMIVESRRPDLMPARRGLDQESEDDPEPEPTNFISLFGRKSVEDEDEPDAEVEAAIASELADRVATVYGNVEDVEYYNKLRSDLLQHVTSK